MEKIKIDVIIPTYRPGKEFEKLLERLGKQSLPARKVLVINTEKKYWQTEWEKKYTFLEVLHIKKEEFDHGGTRKQAAQLSDADVMVFMTQDAVPKNRRLLEELIMPLLENVRAGAAYARQVPKEGCSFVETYTRQFNYPEESSIKEKKDLPHYGIKTFFCSNVCAAYKKQIYEEVGGFTETAIFNEDMILAGKMIQAGYGIVYAAKAEVLHSHNYSCLQQLHRNFDIGVSQADHPEIFSLVASEKEGIRLVRQTLAYVLKKGKIWLVPSVICQSGCKFLGYQVGKRYKKLPLKVILWFTMNKEFWIKKV